MLHNYCNKTSSYFFLKSYHFNHKTYLQMKNIQELLRYIKYSTFDKKFEVMFSVDTNNVRLGIPVD